MEFVNGKIESERCRQVGPSLAQSLVAHICAVPLENIRATTRGDARTALARQICMYLVHIVYGLSLSDVALAFGRDRTTASHACHLVEDKRDDPDFDRQLLRLEGVLRDAACIEVTL